MAKAAYIGVDGVSRKVKKMYVGVDGVARKVKKGYIGVNGVARLFFSSGLQMVSGSFTGPDYDGTVTIKLGFKPTYLLIYGNSEFTNANSMGIPEGWQADVFVYNNGETQYFLSSITAITGSTNTPGTFLTVTSTGFKLQNLNGDGESAMDGTYHYIAFKE